MAILSLPDLILKITDVVYENHERRISGPDLHELLIDMVDSLQYYIDQSIVEPAENFYVSDIQIDLLNKTLILVRDGGIVPANVSEDMTLFSDTRAGFESLPAGTHDIIFTPGAFPDGTTYSLWKEVIVEGYDVGAIAFDRTPAGFEITMSKAFTIEYTATRQL